MSDATKQANVILGPEWTKAFEYDAWATWVNKAKSWTAPHRGRTLCVDALGRICWAGREFARARNEGAFPVSVYVYGLPAGSQKESEHEPLV